MTDTLLLVSLCLIICLTSLLLAFYMYQLVLIDAESRKLAKPKLWAFFAASAQNGAGLPFYLFKRKSSLSFLSASEKSQVLKLKRKIYALLVLALSAFIFVVIVL